MRELHVLHQSRVMMHIEYSDKQALQRYTEKLNKELHGLIIFIADRCRSQYIHTALQYLINIVNVLRVVLN